jgi:hypothetical protein
MVRAAASRRNASVFVVRWMRWPFPPEEQAVCFEDGVRLRCVASQPTLLFRLDRLAGMLRLKQIGGEQARRAFGRWPRGGATESLLRVQRLVVVGFLVVGES